MVQTRGQLLSDGNASFVGEFTKVPSVATWMKCGNSSKGSVVDKGKYFQYFYRKDTLTLYNILYMNSLDHFFPIYLLPDSPVFHTIELVKLPFN